MPVDEPQTGQVIGYSYLWARQHDDGEVSGRKARPVCVVVPVKTREGTVVLFPLTSQPPGRDRLAIEVPEIERRRLKLRGNARCWIILDEANQDRLPGSFHIEPISYDPVVATYGVMSPAFMQIVIKTIARAIRGSQVRLVPRPA